MKFNFYRNTLLQIENIYFQHFAFKIFHDGKPDSVVYLNKYKRENCRYDLTYEPYVTKSVRTPHGKQTLVFQILLFKQLPGNYQSSSKFLCDQLIEKRNETIFS